VSEVALRLPWGAVHGEQRYPVHGGRVGTDSGPRVHNVYRGTSPKRERNPTSRDPPRTLGIDLQ
jgi:hypothetical protein